MTPPQSTPGPDYPQYQDLVAEAKARARREPFVDPANLSPEAGAVARRGRDWAYTVLGRPYSGSHEMTLWESHLLMLADERDVCPPLPEHIAAARLAHEQEQEARAEAEAQWRAAYEAEWRKLCEALPVAVAVAHNFKSTRHCENGYVQGGEHIIPQAPLHRGRLARLRHQALCETTSNAHNLHFPFPSGDGGEQEHRFPTCKRCIKLACTITGLTAPTMLAAPKAGASAGIPNRKFTAKTPRGRRL